MVKIRLKSLRILKFKFIWIFYICTLLFYTRFLSHVSDANVGICMDIFMVEQLFALKICVWTKKMWNNEPVTSWKTGRVQDILDIRFQTHHL